MSGCPVAFHENKEYATCTSPIMHLICFSFLLRGITAVPREIENNAYAKFWRANKVHYGRCASVVSSWYCSATTTNQSSANIHLWNTVRWGNIWHDTKGGRFHISPMDNLLPLGDADDPIQVFCFVGKNPLFLTFLFIVYIVLIFYIYLSNRDKKIEGQVSTFEHFKRTIANFARLCWRNQESFPCRYVLWANWPQIQTIL